MKVVPWVVTYNRWESGPWLERCVEYLLGSPPRGFGTAIEVVELHAHCHDPAPTPPLVVEERERFQAQLAVLPLVRFRRSRRRFEVAYASAFVRRVDLRGHLGIVRLSAGEFALLCQEFAAALLLARRRLKRTDDFDLAGLEAHLHGRLALLPTVTARGRGTSRTSIWSRKSRGRTSDAD